MEHPGVFQHRDGALPRMSQLITSALPVPHEALSLLYSFPISYTDVTTAADGASFSEGDNNKAHSQESN